VLSANELRFPLMSFGRDRIETREALQATVFERGRRPNNAKLATFIHSAGVHWEQGGAWEYESCFFRAFALEDAGAARR